jgi:hypothetical protein
VIEMLERLFNATWHRYVNRFDVVVSIQGDSNVD